MADDSKTTAGFFAHARNYILGGALTGVISFGSTAVFTRLLSIEEFGVLKIYLATVSILTIFAEMNLRGALNRYFFEEHADFPSFVRTTLTFLGGLAVFNLVWTWIAAEPLGRFFDLDARLFYIAVIAATIEVPWSLNWKLMVAKQQSGRYSALRALKDLGGFVVGGLWLWSLPKTDGNIDGSRELGQVYALLAVNGAFALVLLIKLLREARSGRLGKQHLVYALAFGIPLIPHSLSGFVLNTFDRIVIKKIAGDRPAGLYAFAYDVGAAMNTVVTAMNQAWLPIFMTLRTRGQHEAIKALALRYSRVIAALAIVIVLFSRELALLLGGNKMKEALPIIPIVVFGYVGVFVYTIYSNHTFFQRRTWLISIVTIIAGAANVTANYLLIPEFGYTVAAWTTLGSYALLFAMHYVVAAVYLKEDVPPLLPMLAIIGAAALLCWGVVTLEAWIDDVWLTLFAVKLPLFAVIVWWALKMYRAARADAKRAKEADGPATVDGERTEPQGFK